MRKTMIDKDMPRGVLKRMKDVLPPPGELALPEKTVKVTISLNKASVDFFKEQAHKHGAKYQKMIRNLIDQYVTQYAR